ncbi:hypothetical protein Bbelb_312400 [Branchiostoma belcheri]|nr:hypothetical protein Bbelb_312400 [Branchiostoma belcheri]
MRGRPPTQISSVPSCGPASITASLPPTHLSLAQAAEGDLFLLMITSISPVQVKADTELSGDGTRLPGIESTDSRGQPLSSTPGMSLHVNGGGVRAKLDAAARLVRDSLPPFSVRGFDVCPIQSNFIHYDFVLDRLKTRLDAAADELCLDVF